MTPDTLDTLDTLDTNVEILRNMKSIESYRGELSGGATHWDARSYR